MQRQQVESFPDRLFEIAGRNPPRHFDRWAHASIDELHGRISRQAVNERLLLAAQNNALLQAKKWEEEVIALRRDRASDKMAYLQRIGQLEFALTQRQTTGVTTAEHNSIVAGILDGAKTKAVQHLWEMNELKRKLWTAQKFLQRAAKLWDRVRMTHERRHLKRELHLRDVDIAYLRQRIAWYARTPIKYSLTLRGWRRLAMRFGIAIKAITNQAMRTNDSNQVTFARQSPNGVVLAQVIKDYDTWLRIQVDGQAGCEQKHNRRLHQCRPWPGAQAGCGCYMPYKARAGEGCWANEQGIVGIGWKLIWR